MFRRQGGFSSKAAVRSLLLACSLTPLALAFSGTAAQAAPQGPWLLPSIDLSLPSPYAGRAQIATSPDGTATAVWERSNGIEIIVQQATRSPGGTFGTPADLSLQGGESSLADIAFGPDGSATAVWIRSTGGGDVVRASTRPPGGEFGAPEDIFGPAVDADAPEIAIAEDGTATVVASIVVGSDEIVQATTRPPEGSFGAPVNLSAAGGDADRPRIAVAGDGTATAVWHRQVGAAFRIQSATRPPDGAFGSPLTLSEPGAAPVGNAFSPRIAVGPDRTATVVWRRFDGANEIVQASTRVPGGAFATPVDLSAAGQSGKLPDIAFAPDSSATAVWEGPEIESSTRPAGGAFGPPVELTTGAANLSNPGIAIAGDGTTTAIWDAWNGSNDIIQASTRPPGGGFAGPVDLSRSQGDSSAPQIAIDPIGSATVVWQRDNGATDLIQSASTATADFLLGVSKQGDGRGTVKSAPAGIDCGITCAISAAPYSKVRLTAAPDQDSRFSGWGGACEGQVEASCELTMTEARNAVAEFSLGKGRLKITKVTPNKPKVKRGKKVKLKAVVKNTGDATAQGTKVCLKAGKKVKKALKPQGKSCVKRGALGPGAKKSATFKLKATKKAKKGRKYKLSFSLSGTGLPSAKSAVKVKVR